MLGTHRCVSERKQRALELLKAVGLERVSVGAALMKVHWPVR
jgi:hypothetical protein